MPELALYAIEIVSALLFAIVAWVIRSIFSRLEEYGRRVNALEISAARSDSENVTLFKRLDQIETKLDHILENWRSSSK